MWSSLFILFDVDFTPETLKAPLVSLVKPVNYLKLLFKMSQPILIPKSLNDVVLPDQLPPLVLTVFTRPDLLEKVIFSIHQQTLKPQKIIVLADGSRQPADQPLIEQCLDQLESLSRSISVKIIARPQNLGCDQNVISGFTEIFQTHSSLVYLEDDDVPNPYFFDRMCRLLEAYRHHPKVFSISAYANVPKGFEEIITTDFMVSNRVFSWGFGTWADRWQKLDLINHSGQYNPFGHFYDLPINIQTKFTMVNQFWLEKNQQTDWNISFTVASLYHHGIHITPMVSFIKNIGFGHPKSKTYKGSEPKWVNAAYKPDAFPDSLPSNLELPEPLQTYFSSQELVSYLQAQNLWINFSDFIHLSWKFKNLKIQLSLLKFLIAKIPLLFYRWRKGSSI